MNPHLKITDMGLVDVDRFSFVRDERRLERLAQARWAGLTACKCAALAFVVFAALAFVVFVAAVLARAIGCDACAPVSTTRPEAAVARPCAAVTLAPVEHPEAVPPPPDAAAVEVAA